MKSLKLKKFEFNPFPVNTYLLYDEVSKDALLIDAGMSSLNEKEELISFISNEGLCLKGLLNTHLHFDHCLGINDVIETYKVSLYASCKDEFLLKTIQNQAAKFGFKVHPCQAEVKDVKDGDRLSFGSIVLDALHVPGHSPGSIVYYSKDLECIFSGDVLFARSIGRTDLLGGDFDTLIKGIKMKLLTLPTSTIVYPGHGPSTTIGSEQSANFYLR